MDKIFPSTPPAASRIKRMSFSFLSSIADSFNSARSVLSEDGLEDPTILENSPILFSQETSSSPHSSTPSLSLSTPQLLFHLLNHLRSVAISFSRWMMATLESALAQTRLFFSLLAATVWLGMLTNPIRPQPTTNSSIWSPHSAFRRRKIRRRKRKWRWR